MLWPMALATGYIGIHPPAGWSRQFSVVPLQGRHTRPTRNVSAGAHFCSFHSCVWVQHCHHGQRAGPWPWAWAWVRAWVPGVE